MTSTKNCSVSVLCPDKKDASNKIRTQVISPEDLLALEKSVLKTQNRYSNGRISSTAKRNIATVMRDKKSAKLLANLSPEQKKTNNRVHVSNY